MDCREAGRRDIHLIRIDAGRLARRIIAWSGLSNPASLRHDTAEAGLTGFWAVMETGWLKNVPRELRR